MSILFFVFKQMPAYEMRISDWSSDVCSSDLTTDTEKCLAPDRWPSNPFSSIAATGFALTAYGIGAERGYVTRAEAALRTRDCLNFYWTAPQGPAATGMAGPKGFFYHFLNKDRKSQRLNSSH